MRFPEKLRPGDTVGLVCPASGVTPERVEACAAFVRQMGYYVRIGKSCKKSYHGYLAGRDEDRALDINEMFASPDIKAIFCIRGGNGTGRIMNLLDYDMIRKNPKIFIGYSDITNLNMAFYQMCDMVTFHGPMVSSNMLEHFDCYTKKCFYDVLNMEEKYEFVNPPEKKIEVIAPGKAEGRIIGGNLSLLTSMIGTFYAPNFENTILFIEDIYEPVSSVNRMLDQLFHAGIMQQINGLLIGSFDEAENKDDPEFLVPDLMREYFRGFDKPVIAGICCGHCFPTAMLPLGARCEIDTNEKKILFRR